MASVTTNYVLSQLVALLTSPLKIPRPRVIEIVDAITNSGAVEIVHIDPSLHQKAWALLKTRSDKSWSLPASSSCRNDEFSIP